MQCKQCGAKGCKLWREYQTFSPDLLCVNCACDEKGIDSYLVDKDGLRPYLLGFTDQIGWYVPALPCEGGYWGYTSSPDEAIAAWKALPTFPPLQL